MAKYKVLRNLVPEGMPRTDIAHRKGKVIDESVLKGHPEWRDSVEPYDDPRDAAKAKANARLKEMKAAIKTGSGKVSQAPVGQAKEVPTAPASGEVEPVPSGESPSAEKAAKKAMETEEK